MGARIVIEGEVLAKQSGSFEGRASHRMTVGYIDREEGRAAQATVKFETAEEMAKAPPVGAMVQAIFAATPKGQYQTEYAKGRCVQLKTATGTAGAGMDATRRAA